MVKLLAEERESDELRAFLGQTTRRVSSELILTEAARAVLRRAQDEPTAARELLERIPELSERLHLRPVDRDVLAVAGRIEPPGMRTLDAIHVATALSLPGTPAAFVSYDRRQLAAAGGAGLPTASPGIES